MLISFGTGTGRYEEQDLTIFVPPTGDLPQINEDREVFARFGVVELRSSTYVCVAIPEETLREEDDIFDWDRVKEIRIYWSSGRKEWVGFHYAMWVESVWGNDMNARGPYSLDDDWARYVLTAFGMKGMEVDLKDVQHMSPDDIRKLES